MPPITRRCRLSLLLVGFLIASVVGAAACGNGKLILEDKFATLDPAWDFKNSAPTDTRTRTNGPGGLTYQLDEEALVWPLNTAAKHENYEVCGVRDEELCGQHVPCRRALLEPLTTTTTRPTFFPPRSKPQLLLSDEGYLQ
jgi:hypothetical protein